MREGSGEEPGREASALHDPQGGGAGSGAAERGPRQGQRVQRPPPQSHQLAHGQPAHADAAAGRNTGPTAQSSGASPRHPRPRCCAMMMIIGRNRHSLIYG